MAREDIQPRTPREALLLILSYVGEPSTAGSVLGRIKAIAEQGLQPTDPATFEWTT